MTSTIFLEAEEIVAHAVLQLRLARILSHSFHIHHARIIVTFLLPFHGRPLWYVLVSNLFIGAHDVFVSRVQAVVLKCFWPFARGLQLLLHPVNFVDVAIGHQGLVVHERACIVHVSGIGIGRNVAAVVLGAL